MQNLRQQPYSNSDLNKSMLLSNAISAGMYIHYEPNKDAFSCFATIGKKPVGFVIDSEPLCKKDMLHDQKIVAEYVNFIVNQNVYNLEDFGRALQSDNMVVDMENEDILNHCKNSMNQGKYFAYKTMLRKNYEQVGKALNISNSFSTEFKEEMQAQKDNAAKILGNTTVSERQM